MSKQAYLDYREGLEEEVLNILHNYPDWIGKALFRYIDIVANTSAEQEIHTGNSEDIDLEFENEEFNSLRFEYLEILVRIVAENRGIWKVFADKLNNYEKSSFEAKKALDEFAYVMDENLSNAW